MQLSESEGIEGRAFTVTGGLGFVGSALCLALLRRGARSVRSLDRRSASPWSDDIRTAGVRCIQGDVSNKKDVERAVDGVDCVFHLASYGMSGKEMLQTQLIDKINIGGTCNVIDACFVKGITRLVYVSTYNVVFGGKEIVNGNEFFPYFPIEDHVDSYGRSKSVAEQLVIKSNGRPLKDDKGGRRLLYTCAVRPAAIYGPGEERHLPRILSLAKRDLLFFRIAKEDVKTDWVYVDNLVLALIQASMGLLDDIPDRKGQRPVASGQAYFISDGSPINTFDSLVNPLVRSLGYGLPKYTLGVKEALRLSNFFLVLYIMLFPWLNQPWLPQPLLLPAEVYKVGVTHYFSYVKAKDELGYVPMVSHQDGLAATISYWQKRKMRELDSPPFYLSFLVVLGLILTFCVAYLPPYGPLKYVLAVGLFVFRSQWGIHFLFVASVMAHVVEAFYAWSLAKRVDPANSKGWFWQTLVVGYPSLRLLKRRQPNK